MLVEICDDESEWSKRVNDYIREFNMNQKLIKIKRINEIKNMINWHDT